MSRCFPYPPPGYEKNGIRDDALIHSIKIQREGEKAKKERKKEKKREKKEKKLSQENGEVGSKKHSHKRRHGDERYKDDQKKGDCQKRGNEAEHVEKSSLTEEPVRSQNSSDSTFNSNKRQKQISSPEARHYSGSIIRIRLPIQRHKDPEVQPSKEQPCPASRRTIDASIKQMHEPVPVLGREQVEHQCSTSKSTGHLSGLGKDRPDLLSGASEVIAHETKPALPVSLCSNCSPTSALNFRKLVEDWVPPQMPTIYTNLDSQDWLFDAKQKKNKNCEAKRNNACSDDLQHGNSTMWPQSFYLPEADIYALPFTVPF